MITIDLAIETFEASEFVRLEVRLVCVSQAVYLASYQCH